MAISLPGISIHWAFNTLDQQQQKIHLFAPRDADMSNAMQANSNDELSQILHCCQNKSKTKVAFAVIHRLRF